MMKRTESDEEKIKVQFYDSIADEQLKFAVIISKSAGKWVLCKHKERDTFEIPGGHREENESIDETARRELYEETGAITFSLTPVCVYSVTGKTRAVSSEEESFGMLYFTDISVFETELHSEIEKVVLFDDLPTELTYPLIHPMMIDEYERRNKAI